MAELKTHFLFPRNYSSKLIDLQFQKERDLSGNNFTDILQNNSSNIRLSYKCHTKIETSGQGLPIKEVKSEKNCFQNFAHPLLMQENIKK